MLYYKNRKWNICEEQVKYLKNREETTQYVGAEGHDWWTDFDSKWEHTVIVEFIPITPTNEQLARFDEIGQLNIPEGFGSEVSMYVKDGVFPEGISHPLINLQLAKQVQELQQTIDTMLGV